MPRPSEAVITRPDPYWTLYEPTGIGVVRSTWFAPTVAYEVEFHKIGHDYQTRALLLAEQVQVEEGSLLPAELTEGTAGHAVHA